MADGPLSLQPGELLTDARTSIFAESADAYIGVKKYA
jgi:hypothetical protein